MLRYNIQQFLITFAEGFRCAETVIGSVVDQNVVRARIPRRGIGKAVGIRLLSAGYASASAFCHAYTAVAHDIRL